MRIYKIIYPLLSMCFSLCWMNKAAAQSFLNPVKDHLHITLGSENRTTNFRWSIAGNPDGTGPNVLSELIYNPIYSIGGRLRADYNVFKGLSIRLNGGALTTYRGDATDIDYNGDNRTDYVPPIEGDTLFNSSNGKMLYYDLSLSYTFLAKDGLEFSGGAGYQFSQETYSLLDRDIPDLNTSYKTWWKTAQIFLNANVRVLPNLYLTPEVTYLRGIYDAEANWNLIADFQHPVSFIHQANSSGWNYDINLRYQFTKHIGISGEWMYSNWKTDKGLDRLFLTNGETPETQMNGAFKKSSIIRLSATYTF